MLKHLRHALTKFYQTWSIKGVAGALFFHRDVLKNFENEKVFLCMKIAEIDMAGQF